MKSTLFSILFLLISYQATSQEYTPLVVENARWVIGVDDIESFQTSLDYVYEYFLRGDTLIEDHTFKKIWLRNYEVESSNNYYLINNQTVIIGYLREDVSQKKIYGRDIDLQGNFPIGSLIGFNWCFDISDEILLYDFDIKLDDTLKTCIGFYNQNITFISEEIRSYFGYSRKCIDIGGDYLFIEGIGHEAGFLENFESNVSGFSIGLLDFCIGTESECGIILSTKETGHLTSFKAYSIGSNSIIIESEAPIKHANIYSIDGRLLEQIALEPSQRIIESSALDFHTNSIIILEIEFNEGGRITKKVDIHP